MKQSSFMASSALPLLLLFLLGTAPIFAIDTWNIDCGGNETFVNAINQTFEGDAPYIRSGVSKDVPDATRNGFRQEFSTLREFPQESWAKSCYSVPVEQGTKVMVRVWFYYGNYDGANSPPEFDVQFDTVKYTCGVSLTNVAWPVRCEMVYWTTKKQGTDICFIRTDSTELDQSPFVSAIEVRQLPSNVYGTFNFSKSAISLRQRVAFGADRDIIYPDDTYNRNWTYNSQRAIEGDGVYKPIIVKRENVTAVDTSGAPNAPPALLFQAAAAAPIVNNQSAANLTMRIPWLTSDLQKVYITMYFTEPIASSGTSAQKKRVFNVYMNGQLIGNASDPIQPLYGFAKEVSYTLTQVSNETIFDLVPAKGSTLPPAISGMEIFDIFDMANATDSKDVETLSTLQGIFTVFGNWTGDPCLPEDYIWEWVGCKYPDPSPARINKLLLNGHQFSGNIPDFSSLDALEYIDLSNNSFTGSVPEFIASLPNLQTLDLSFNDFDGLPTSLRDKENFTLITIGNPKLLASNTSSAGPSGTTPTSSATSACYKARIYSLSIFILVVAIIAII